MRRSEGELEAGELGADGLGVAEFEAGGLAVAGFLGRGLGAVELEAGGLEAVEPVGGESFDGAGLEDVEGWPGGASFGASAGSSVRMAGAGGFLF